MSAPDRRDAYRRLGIALRTGDAEPSALPSPRACPRGPGASDRASLPPDAQPARPFDRAAAMARFVAAAWPALSPTGVSWLGFYQEVPGAPESERLVLMAREPRPACSPIGLHGACGRCLCSGEPLVVRDVAELGPNYIACDPRDRSELVVPCLAADGRAWAVLDLDSHEVGAFDLADAESLVALLRRAGLSM